MDHINMDVQNKAIEKIKEKTDQKPCIECGNKEWQGDIYNLPFDKEYMTCYRIVCKNCGYVRFFNLDDLLLDEPVRSNIDLLHL